MEADLKQIPDAIWKTAQESDTAAFEKAAEDCIVTWFREKRWFGGLPTDLPPLSQEERLQRMKDLIGYWQTGCRSVIDERLLADILQRRSRLSS